MGFLARLLGRKQPSVPAGANGEPASEHGDIAPVLAPALQAFQAGDHGQALALASLHLGAGADAQRLCALSLSAMDRHAEAFPYWQALFEVEPSAHNALQLATVSVMCHQVDRGEAWLDKFHQLNADSHELPVPLTVSNFLSALEQAGHADRSLPYLAWLREGYAQLSVTDDHYLHMRGMPFLHVFLERSLPLLRQQLPAGDIGPWYQSMRDRLDAPGQAAVDAHLRRIKA